MFNKQTKRNRGFRQIGKLLAEILLSIVIIINLILNR